MRTFLSTIFLLGCSEVSQGSLVGPYKDVSINFDWNANVIGGASFLNSVRGTGVDVVTWAFATGECGSETWAGIPGQTLADANVKNWAAAGQRYIVSTGGAAGSFTCGTDAGFSAFVDRYLSDAMIGVDFDLEGSQSEAAITSIVQRVKTAQKKYPSLTFSFTLATLGGLPQASPSLGSVGVMTMGVIQKLQLQDYKVNLMTMDYGSVAVGNCLTDGSGSCNMSASAIQAAKNLNQQFGVPYAQMEVTPMIGGNDSPGETFTINDAVVVSDFARSNGLDVHYWSWDRDNDCPPGPASPTCNSYGQAGPLGFAKTFASTSPQPTKPGTTASPIKPGTTASPTKGCWDILQDPVCGDCSGCLWESQNICYATYPKEACEAHVDAFFRWCGA